ncbi:hypothetical protein VTI74DRAFT_11057 [Chaetomium olivicolor]
MSLPICKLASPRYHLLHAQRKTMRMHTRSHRTSEMPFPSQDTPYLPRSPKPFTNTAIPIRQSQKRNRLRPLKRISAFHSLPSANSTGLDAHHGLEPILGLKVRDPLRLLSPGVPDHDISQVVARDTVDGLALLEHSDRTLGRIDAVCFGGDGEGGVGLGF